MNSSATLPSILATDTGPMLYTYLTREAQAAVSCTHRRGNEAFQAYKTRYKADYCVKWLFPQAANWRLSGGQLDKLADTYGLAKAQWGKDRCKLGALATTVKWIPRISTALMRGGVGGLVGLTTSVALTVLAATAFGVVQGWSNGPRVGITAACFGVREMLHFTVSSRTGAYYFLGSISALLLGVGGNIVVGPFLTKKYLFMVQLTPSKKVVDKPKKLVKNSSLDRWGRLGMISKKTYIEAKLRQTLKNVTKLAE